MRARRSSDAGLSSVKQKATADRSAIDVKDKSSFGLLRDMRINLTIGFFEVRGAVGSKMRQASGATANAVGVYEHSPFRRRQSRDNLGRREWLIPVIELSLSLLFLRLR